VYYWVKYGNGQPVPITEFCSVVGLLIEAAKSKFDETKNIGTGNLLLYFPGDATESLVNWNSVPTTSSGPNPFILKIAVIIPFIHSISNRSEA